MPFSFACQCGKKYRAKDEQAGKRFTCKACGAKLVIGRPEAASTPPRPDVVKEKSPRPAASKPPEPLPAASRQQPKKSKSNLTRWLLLGVVVGPGLACMGVCGGCYYMAMSFGTEVIEASVKETLATDPTVQEHIGELESCETSWFALHANSSNKTRTFVFYLKGSKGNGQATVIIPEQESSTKHIICYPQTLTMSDGETYDLTKNNSGGFIDFFRKNMQ